MVHINYICGRSSGARKDEEMDRVIKLGRYSGARGFGHGLGFMGFNDRGVTFEELEGLEEFNGWE